MIEIIREAGQLENIKTEWRELARRFATPLLSYEWGTSAAAAFAGEDDLRVVVCKKDGGTICGIAPLIESGGSSAKKLSVVGSDQLGEPGGFLYESQESLAELVQGVLSLDLPVCLSRVPGPCGELEVFKSLSRFRGFTVSSDGLGSPYLPISGSWEEQGRPEGNLKILIM